MIRPYSPFDTVGIAVDVGTVEASSSSEPVIFAIGVVRDPVIKFVNSQTLQEEDRSAFCWSEFTNIHDVVSEVPAHYILSATLTVPVID